MLNRGFLFLFIIQRSERDSLLKDLRKKETRKSLKKVETRGRPPSKPLPVLPDVPPPSFRSVSPRTTQSSLSPTVRSVSPQSVPNGVARPTRPHSVHSFEMGQPPNKPLPPSPRAKSPLPRSPVPMRRTGREQEVKDTSVTFQLVITRTVKVSSKSSLKDLSQAATDALRLPEDSVALW